jgi:hypothetical protein
MMSLFFSVIGCVAALAVSASLLAFAVSNVVVAMTNARWSRDEIVKKDARKELGNLLIYSSHWFSESDPTWQAIKVIGAEISRSGDFDVSMCRDKWREAIVGTKEAP